MIMRNFLPISYVCLLFIVLFSSEISAQETYSQVKVYLNDVIQFNDLAEQGYDVEHFEGTLESGILFYVTKRELANLRESNFSFDVVIEDYAAYYKKIQEEDKVNLSMVQRSSKVGGGFGYGSMGGFYTFSEIEDKLDEMVQDYPNLVTPKESIGTTLEGRPIWMVKISDNPLVNENEPAAHFDALHHAREPLSMGTTINFMFWLLENYETDPQVQFLVDHREIYFVPVVNPDGYVYNELTDPNGGGLWRKNRNTNGGSGCLGVDLNRNYSYEFGMNNSCSSPDPCSNIYRGTGPFSEAEAAALRDHLQTVTPRTAFSIHSTAGSYLMPFGFDTTPPAFPIYSEWASAFLSENDYPYGVTFQMLGYTTCGTTRDYLHTEGIYGWTPEIDGSGFWPPQSTIFDLVGENVYPLFYQSWLAGGYMDIQSHTLLQDAIGGTTMGMTVEVKNIGLGDAENVSVGITASSPEITVSSPEDFGTVIARERASNVGAPFEISIPNDFTENAFDVTIDVMQDGVLNNSITVRIFVGEKTSFLMDNAENGTVNWTESGNGISWGTIEDDSYSGIKSFGDSDNGNGENNTLNHFTMVDPIDLTSTVEPVVSFLSKYSIEGGDNAFFQISTDGGTSWQNLDNYSGGETWHFLHYPLSDYSGFSDVRFRFQLSNNGSVPGDGFYFDDFEIADFDASVLATMDRHLNTMVVTPNPFTNEITIAVTGTNNLNSTVTLNNLAGKLVSATSVIEDNRIKIKDLDRLSTGVYFLTISEGKQNRIIKLIKE